MVKEVMNETMNWCAREEMMVMGTNDEQVGTKESWKFIPERRCRNFCSCGSS